MAFIYVDENIFVLSGMHPYLITSRRLQLPFSDAPTSIQGLSLCMGHSLPMSLGVGPIGRCAASVIGPSNSFRGLLCCVKWLSRQSWPVVVLFTTALAAGYRLLGIGVSVNLDQAFFSRLMFRSKRKQGANNILNEINTIYIIV